MSEIRIDIRRNLVTVIVDIETRPDRQRAFLDRLERMIAEFTRLQTGFISSAVHAAEDGSAVLNYSQWRDMQSFEAFRDHPEAERHIGELRDICETMTARVMPPRFVYSD